MGYAPGWQVRCRVCGLTIEAGVTGPIVRLAAVGTSYSLGRCSSCTRVRLLVIERRSDPNAKVIPPTGYAPGWHVRCSRCGDERDAGSVGLIIHPAQEPTIISGHCAKCGGKRRLLIEPADSVTHPARTPSKS